MRMKSWMLSAVFALTVVIMCGCGKTSEQRIVEQLELGQKYLAEGKYEEAIIMFQKVIEMEPKIWEAYVGMASSYEEQKQYDEMLLALDNGINAMGDDELSSEDIETVMEMYDRLSGIFSAQGELEAEISCYEKILLLQPENNKVSRKIEECKKIEENKTNLEEMALSIVNEENYDFQDMEILSEEFQAAIEDLAQPVIMKAESSKYIGIYPGGYIYYGDMADGKREGKAHWYYGNKKRMTIVNCEWRNDMPNGDCIVESYINMDEIDRKEGKSYAKYARDEGKVDDGIYQGAWDFYWDMEIEGHCDHEWSVDIDDGYLQMDDSGNAGYCKNCGANLLGGKSGYRIAGVEEIY